MKLAIVGTGYVGLVTGTCLAELGHDITCVDIDREKIGMLNQGEIPIYEPGLDELIEKNKERLTFTTNLAQAIEGAEAVFIAVGTPDKHGRADLSAVFKVAESIKAAANDYLVVINKSTVPVGTGKKVQNIFADKDLDVASNPEFLREGAAIGDFLNPDRIVVGTATQQAKEVMQRIYEPLTTQGRPILFTDIPSAEMIKYAANAMLATRISFVNMLAPLCEKAGADIQTVAKGMGLDTRIGPKFLNAGIGYGGSCFPKDVKALIHTLKEHDCQASILESVESINAYQKRLAITKLKKFIPILNGKTVALWGLAFKPETDDIREAPSLVLIERLKREGAFIRAYDSTAKEAVEKLHPDITYTETPLEATETADALIIATEWKEFQQINPELIKAKIIIDGRNVFDATKMRELGFTYTSIGRQ